MNFELTCEIGSDSFIFRLVVQGAPPFVVVYANAAYASLTGIECHAVIGKPIAALLSIPESTSGDGEAVSTRDSSPSLTQDASRPEGPSQGIEAHGHAAAVEAGRARAASVLDVDMSLERLIAKSGFGNYHTINVKTKPAIVGRDVTVVHQDTQPLNQCKVGTSSSSRGDQGSHTSSIPSVCGNKVFATCRMGVSPVVSSPNAMDDYTVVTDRDQETHHHHHHHGGSTSEKHHSLKRGEGGASSNPAHAKRRKHHHHSGHDEQSLPSPAFNRSMLMMTDANRRITQRTVSHFVIQLELVDSVSAEQVNAGSLSSATNSTKVEARLYGLTTAEAKRRRIAMNGDAVLAEAAPRDAAASHELPPPQQQDVAQRQAVGGEIDDESEDSDTVVPVVACG